MDWTGRLLPLSEYGPTSEYDSNSGYGSTASDLPQQQTVSLRDLDLGRWRPAESYGYDTSASNDLDVPNERLDISLQKTFQQSLEQSDGMSPTTYTSGITFDSPESDISMTGDETDDEPDLDAPMAYARFHGLCRDLPIDHPLSSDLIPLPSEDFHPDMEEHPGLLRAEALQAEVWEGLKNERLDVDRETATFLASLLKAAKRFELGPIDVEVELDGLHRLKLELPLLARDHEVEMLALRRRNEVRVCSGGIKPFQLDVEKDEGFDFPRAEIDKKLSLDRELENEKLDVGKDTVELLCGLRELWSGKHVGLVDGLYESYKKGKAIRVSPPLLPISPPYTPSVPASEAMQIDLTSTPEDLIAKDAAAAEKEVLDSQQVTDVTPADGPLFNAEEVSAAIESYTAVPSSSSPLARKRLRSLQLEPPLTPHDHPESTSDAEGSSAKKIKKVHLDTSLVALLSGLQTGGLDTQPGIVEQQAVELQDIILREAESVHQQLQNEHLIEIDTTLRTKVPQLESVQAQPPWELYKNTEVSGSTLQSQQMMLRYFSQELLRDTHKWGGITKLERTLLWSPFPRHLAKVDLDERFDGDGASLEQFLHDMKLDDATGDIDVQPMIIRDLRGHESDDDEIEPAMIEDDDLDGDIAEEEIQVPEHASAIPLGVKPVLVESERLRELDPVAKLVAKPSALLSAAFSGTSAATANLMQGDGLAHFMQLRGKAPRIPNLAGEALPPAAKTNLAPAAVMVPQVDNRQGEEKEKEVATISIPVPEVKKFASHLKIPIIVSTTFVAANRQLLRLLQTALPNTDICERDAAIMLPIDNSSSRIPTEEADLTISPSTGVILTTLQKLKQKPLPGQQQTSPTSGFRARITSTAPRYERLIILVKEGSPTQVENTTASATIVNPLDDLDCMALSDLTEWTITTLSDGPEIQILYIPGGESEAANWLAAAISHHHHQEDPVSENVDGDDGEICLIHGETMWERWLRAAGLNAFAAQIVLRHLRLSNPDPSDDSGEDSRTPPRFGLQAFAAMALDERLEVFAPLLGGERVLRSVSGVLDDGWRGGRVCWEAC